MWLDMFFNKYICMLLLILNLVWIFFMENVNVGLFVVIIMLFFLKWLLVYVILWINYGFIIVVGGRFLLFD